jgi:hypothetical protein
MPPSIPSSLPLLQQYTRQSFPVFSEGFISAILVGMVDASKNVRIHLPYDQADLKSILRYAKSHDVERDGRYDIRKPPRLNIWTHNWSNPGCRAESCVMFSLAFDWNTASLMSVQMQPGYVWQVFLDELARLESAALGKIVYGQHRGEPKT